MTWAGRATRSSPTSGPLLAGTRPRWIGGFRKVGVLVQSAVGILQVKRYARQDDVKRLVTTDEAEVLEYLAQQD